MHVEYVPLLELQREIYRMPRSIARFKNYLRIAVGEGVTEPEIPPLIALNPMAREHVPALVDAYIELDADAIAARAVAAAAPGLADAPGDIKLSLVIADDLKGGWTNRYAAEFGHRIGSAQALLTRKKWSAPEGTGAEISRRPWQTGLLWSSEPASLETAREEILTTLYRTAYVGTHGPARTLREMLAQEGWCMARAACAGPTLDAEDLEYTRAVIAEHFDDGDMRTAIECLFGDAGARTLGFTSRGLSPRAGLALALHDARVQA